MTDERHSGWPVVQLSSIVDCCAAALAADLFAPLDLNWASGFTLECGVLQGRMKQGWCGLLELQRLKEKTFAVDIHA